MAAAPKISVLVLVSVVAEEQASKGCNKGLQVPLFSKNHGICNSVKAISTEVLKIYVDMLQCQTQALEEYYYPIANSLP